jgi:hypothetical protein
MRPKKNYNKTGERIKNCEEYSYWTSLEKKREMFSQVDVFQL